MSGRPMRERWFILLPTGILGGVVGGLVGMLGSSQWPVWAVAVAAVGSSGLAGVGLMWVAGRAYEIGASEAYAHATAELQADIAVAQKAQRVADDWARRHWPPVN